MRIPGISYVQGRNAGPRGPKYGIAIHNTSNSATASAEASYATRRTDGVSAHFYVDDKQVIQSLEIDVRAGHAGSSNGNNYAVAVEITGVNAWTRQQWLDRVAWDQLGRVLAAVCKRYGIQVRRASVDEMRRNPKVKAIYSHDDMRRAWGGTTHTDPGPNFPWDRLFAAVKAASGEGAEDEDMGLSTKQLANTKRSEQQAVADVWWTMHEGNPGSWLAKQITEARLREEAILAAVQGKGADAILRRINEIAAAETARDEQASRERAALADLVRQGADGTLAAEEVVRRIGELLTASPAA